MTIKHDDLVLSEKDGDVDADSDYDEQWRSEKSLPDGRCKSIAIREEMLRPFVDMRKFNPT
jgi:hypothetical protein